MSSNARRAVTMSAVVTLTAKGPLFVSYAELIRHDNYSI